MALDVHSDYQYFDGTETVTYVALSATSVNAGGTKVESSVETTVPNVLRHGATLHEIILDGAGGITVDTKWQIPIELLARNGVPFAPKVEDRIRDSLGVVHHILHFEIVTLVSRYRVYTRRI